MRVVEKLALRSAAATLEKLADMLDEYPNWRGGKGAMPVTHFVKIQGKKTPAFTSADLRYIASYLED